MSNEITYSASLKCVNGSYQDQVSNTSQSQNQTTQGGINQLLTITTTASAVSVGPVSTSGMYAVVNLDPTNYVELGVDVSSTFYPFERVLAGETHISRLSPSATLYAKANTASVNIQLFLLEA